MNFSTRFLMLLIALCASAVLLAPTASAADPTAGDKVVIPLGKKGSGLRVKGVKIRAIKPAKLVGATVSLPVSTVTLPRGNEGQLVLRGGFQVRSGKRKVAIQGLMLKLVGNRLTVTGKAGTSRYVLFSGSAGGSSIDLAKTAVQLKVPRLKPTRKLVKSLNKTLKSKRFKVKTLGTVLGGSTAYFPPLAPKPENPSQGYWTEPTLPTRPPTAADVTTASPLDWWARVSWVNYIGQPAQLTGVTALGAINTCGEALPPATGVEYNNGFRYPFNATGSWWDAASQTGVLNYSGSVRFFFPDRFDISFVDPQIVIQPSGRTMNMRIVTATYPSGKNADMFRLVAGSTFDYDVMTDSATDGVFAGMYPKNDTFGCSIFSYTQP